MSDKSYSPAIVLKNCVARWTYSLRKPDENGKRSLTLLIPKDSETMTKLDTAATELAKEHFGELKGLTFPYHDGDAPSGTSNEVKSETYKEYGGRYFVTANSYKEIPVFDKRGNRIDAESIYDGCVVNAKVVLATYNKDASKKIFKEGITAYLNAVMFQADGERLSSSGDDEDFEFENFDLDQADTVALM